MHRQLGVLRHGSRQAGDSVCLLWRLERGDGAGRVYSDGVLGDFSKVDVLARGQVGSETVASDTGLSKLVVEMIFTDTLSPACWSASLQSDSSMERWVTFQY